MKKNYANARSDEEYRLMSEDYSKIPFSFCYGGKVFDGFSDKEMICKNKEILSSEDKETQIITFLLEDSVKITLLLTHYFSHGVTEHTVWFENVSDKNSKQIEKIKTEITFSGKYPVLKGILGDHVNYYRPYCMDMQNNSVEFSSDSGRATHINFPYFNLEYGNCGVMLAIGWAGSWSARFVSESDEKCTYTATSVNGMNTYLKPGEKIRTALFVAAYYNVRNENYATNYWRSWYITHNLPKADAEKNDLQPFSTCFLASDTGLPNSDGSISERYTTWRPSMEKMLSENIKVDFRWFDAGWYVAPDGTSAIPFEPDHDWWPTVGTWELDPVKWPGTTFRDSTDFARDHGMKTLVWFEPERVTDPENLAKNFGYNSEWAIQIDGSRAISNNIGDPACFQWTTDRICKMLTDNKVELYREDNNCDSASLWKHLDKKEGNGRHGITESKFIAGHYEMWDKIIECTLSHGGCGFVDSCASGGGRNDLESMRRGIPILRSDHDRTKTSVRLSITTALNKWIPFCGANTKEKKEELAKTGISDPYVWRCSYLSVLNIDSQFVYDETQNFDILRFGLAEWKKVSPYLLKDFYVLTPWHSEFDTTDFTAFCYYDPEQERGVLFAFRQEHCERNECTVKLPFAENNDNYTMTDEDTGSSSIVCGEIKLSFDSPRSAKLLWIKKEQ